MNFILSILPGKLGKMQRRITVLRFDEDIY